MTNVLNNLYFPANTQRRPFFVPEFYALMGFQCAKDI
jgi:hypothetical protein